jgi:P4 family phage/plasmid primase-like protien
MAKIYICKDCQKKGTWTENHNECEINYINTRRNKGIERTSKDCQCENIGHGWNVTVDYEKPVTKQDFEDYNTIDNLILNKIEHKETERIDLVSNILINKYNFVTAINTDKIYRFTGKIYESEKAVSTINEETENNIINCKIDDVKQVISKIKRKTYKDLDEFDNDSNLLTVENGILHLDTLELTAHTPTNLSKILIPCEFNKPNSDDIEVNLKNTLFWKYLKNSFTVKTKFIKKDFETVLEVMAAVFIKHNIDEKSIMNLGNGENGKSVLLDYLSSLIGKDNISHIPLQLLADDKFAMARLDGKLANVFADLEKNELRHTGCIKVISSGEPIFAQNKGRDGFNLYPMAKLIFSTNKFPKVFDQSQGFFRRWIIIKWNRNFENDIDRIDNLKESLIENQEEKNLVFSSLMILANQLKIKGKFTHTQDWETIKKLWNENADPVNDFIENYILESVGWKTKRETYQFYKKKMFEKGETPLGMGQFSKAFSEYYEESKSGSVRIWLNIEFNETEMKKLI